MQTSNNRLGALGGNSSFGLLSRLSLMMFLQYFVQGAYLPIASVYLEKSLGFTPREVGIFISALAVGPILAPFIVGQLVDRMFATERVIAACHFVGGLLMLWLSVQEEVWPVVVLGTLYSILYVPTMMLSNSLSFQHLKDSEMEFPRVRLFGTLGFIMPAFIIELWWLRGLEGDARVGGNLHPLRLLIEWQSLCEDQLQMTPIVGVVGHPRFDLLGTHEKLLGPAKRRRNQIHVSLW